MFAAHAPSGLLVPFTAMGFLYAVASTLPQQIDDRDADKKAGIRTTAVAYGKNFASTLITVCMAAGGLLFLFVYYGILPFWLFALALALLLVNYYPLLGGAKLAGARGLVFHAVAVLFALLSHIY
jgi:4-hydroxybenzoate polyprenyltransferase